MNQSTLTRSLVSIAAFVIFIAGLRAAANIIVPFLLAVFLAVITSPLMIQLRKHGVRPPFAVVTILMMVMGVMWVLVRVAGASIRQFADNAPRYQFELRLITRDWVAWLQEKGIEADPETINAFFNPANAMGTIINYLTYFLRGMLTNTFLILITVLFLLLELAGLPQKLRMAFGSEHPSINGWERFTAALNRYLAIKSVISLFTGISAYILVRVADIDFALLWGILAFMLNYVPNIGSILAAIPPVMLAMVLHDTPRALWVLFGYLCINITFGNLIEPRVMGKGLGLSTLIVWLSLVFWGWVFGPVGMLLSVPLTLVVKIAMESRQETMWLAILLGSDPGEGNLELTAPSPGEDEPEAAA